MTKYLPSLSQLSQAAIANVFAVVVLAFIVSKSPKLKALVKNYDCN